MTVALRMPRLRACDSQALSGSSNNTTRWRTHKEVIVQQQQQQHLSPYYMHQEVDWEACV